MPIFRTREELVARLREILRLTVPELDTKPGSVARDIMIEPQAEVTSDLYQTLFDVSRLGNLDLLRGAELDNFASNRGITRSPATRSTGTILLTISSFIGDADINVPAGSIVGTRGGINFNITNDLIIRGSDRNFLAATASRFRADLDSQGISDIFAIETDIEATIPGSIGIVAPFTIRSHNIPGISNVVNITPTSGGNDVEDDNTFRNIIKLRISGNNTGTNAGYLGTVLTIGGVQDAFVAGPGSPLQLRDETIAFLDENNNLQIQQEGMGGTVDIFILGQNLVNTSQSFVFNDQSGLGDATDESNDIILGQFNLNDLDLTLSERRINALANNAVPLQPVDRIVSLTGSVSGPNFIEAFIDPETGEQKGNFELIKDDSTISGSAFARDKIHFISNEIELSLEDQTKGELNEQDDLQFPDVNTVIRVVQEVDIQNENSQIDSIDRSIIIPRLHPASDVTRVFNVTTGERYIVIKQPTENDHTVEISGNNLPTTTDIIQVDYTYTQEFDDDIDYAHPGLEDFIRPVADSIDWSRSNVIDGELSEVVDSGGSKTITVTHEINSVISVKNATTEEELFSIAGGDGSSSNNVITLPSGSSVLNGTSVSAVYIAEIFNLLDETDIADIASQTVNNLEIQPASFQTDVFGTRYIRYAPTKLLLTVSGISNRGRVAVTGNTFEKISDQSFIVPAAQGNSLTLDLSSLITADRLKSLSSTDLTNISLAKIVSVENLTQTVDGEPYVYDLTGYRLNDNSKDLNSAVSDSSLSLRQFAISSSAGSNANFIPQFNDTLRITFYYSQEDRIESILFSEDGQLLTSKTFFEISNIAVSGFTNVSGVFNGTLQVDSVNQPQNVTVYQADYNYVAPKENERLTVNFAYNKVIGDATSILEEARNITADVLTREAESIPVNVTVSVIADSDLNINILTFTQDIQNIITQFLTSAELGRTIDSSDLIVFVDDNVTGVDRITVNLFERQDSPGNTLSIGVEDNQAISPGIITVNIESR